MDKGTSIGRVRGLGAAHSGTHHWLMQRVAASGNLFLGLWLVFSLIMLPNFSFYTVREWLTGIVPATAMGLLILSFFWETRLGLQVAIEDYVHSGANKIAAIWVMNLLVFAGAAFGLFCVIRLALGGA